jgi:hypothetical protein
MLQIRNGFNADPDPTFNLNADPNFTRKVYFMPVLRTRIRIRIHMFLGLPDPDP